MAAFTKKQLRAIVITAIADNLYGRCNYLGLWIFLSVGSDSYSLYWLPREMKSEKLAQKFHTDGRDSGSGSDWLQICFNQSEALP